VFSGSCFASDTNHIKDPPPRLHCFFSKHLQVAAVLTLSEAVYKQVTFLSSDWQPGSCALQP